MQIFFFIEQKAFTGTHTTSVSIFYPKCQNRKHFRNQSTGHGFALECLFFVFGFFFPLLSLSFGTGLFCESLHRRITRSAVSGS